MSPASTPHSFVLEAGARTDGPCLLPRFFDSLLLLDELMSVFLVPLLHNRLQLSADMTGRVALEGRLHCIERGVLVRVLAEEVRGGEIQILRQVER